jgi:hypothetical protein
MQRLLLRGAAFTIVIGIFVTAGTVTASALHNRVAAKGSARAAQPLDSVASVAPTVSPDSAPTRDTTQSAVQLAGQPAPVAVVEPPTPPFEAVIAHGQSTLVGGATAVRSDSEVIVTFDNQTMRTRRADKFEQVVRATLVSVYGAPMKDVLSSVPIGAIAEQGELLTELPSRGVRIPLNGAWMARLFPETRPGQDGPLVIRYRVRIAPIN